MSTWMSIDAHASSRNGWSKPGHRDWSARAASPPKTAASLSNGSEEDEYDELESLPSRTTSPVQMKTKELEARPTLHPLFFPPVVNNNTSTMSSSIFSGKTSIYDLDRSRHGNGLADSLRLPPLRLPGGSPPEHTSALAPTFLTYRLPPISPISPLSSSSTSASAASSSSRATQHLSPNLKPTHYHPYPPRSPKPASDDGRPSPILNHSGSPPLLAPLSASTPTCNIATSGHRPPPRYHRQVTLRDDSTTGTTLTRTPMEQMSIVGPHLITQLQRKAIRPAGPGDPSNPRGDPDATGRPIWAAHARAECRWTSADGRVCGELLSRDNWRTHLLSVHGVGAGMRLRPTASTPVAADVPANALRCRWASCELAPDGCATLSNLHKHIYNLHLALDWRECVLCLQVFARADACKRHFGRPGCLRNRAKHEKTVRRNARDPSRQVWYPQFPLDRPGSREGIKDREVAEDSEGPSDSGMESDG